MTRRAEKRTERAVRDALAAVGREKKRSKSGRRRLLLIAVAIAAFLVLLTLLPESEPGGVASPARLAAQTAAVETAWRLTVTEGNRGSLGRMLDACGRGRVASAGNNR